VPTQFPPQVSSGPLGLAGGGWVFTSKKINNKAVLKNQLSILMAAFLFVNQNRLFPPPASSSGKSIKEKKG